MSDDSGRGDDLAADGADDDGREWRFDPQDFPGDEDDADDADDAGGEADDAEGEGNVAGEFVPEMPIEPGSPDLGNAVWVALGAYVAVLGLARLFVYVQGFHGRDLLVLTAGTLLVTLAFMGYFGLLTPDGSSDS